MRKDAEETKLYDSTGSTVGTGKDCHDKASGWILQAGSCRHSHTEDHPGRIRFKRRKCTEPGKRNRKDTAR